MASQIGKKQLREDQHKNITWANKPWRKEKFLSSRRRRNKTV